MKKNPGSWVLSPHRGASPLELSVGMGGWVGVYVWRWVREYVNLENKKKVHGWLSFTCYNKYEREKRILWLRQLKGCKRAQTGCKRDQQIAISTLDSTFLPSSSRTQEWYPEDQVMFTRTQPWHRTENVRNKFSSISLVLKLFSSF